jgi:hypothetical protein
MHWTRSGQDSSPRAPADHDPQLRVSPYSGPVLAPFPRRRSAQRYPSQPPRSKGDRQRLCDMAGAPGEAINWS